MIKRGLTLAFLGLVVLAVSTPWAISQQDGDVPKYNAAPPAKGSPLPPILGREQLAGKIPAVLHQQPCYCYCDRGMEHNSLHSCFEGIHGAQCSVCLKELYYSYSMNKKGKTAAQI